MNCLRQMVSSTTGGTDVSGVSGDQHKSCFGVWGQRNPSDSLDMMILMAPRSHEEDFVLTRGCYSTSLLVRRTLRYLVIAAGSSSTTRRPQPIYPGNPMQGHWFRGQVI